MGTDALGPSPAVLGAPLARRDKVQSTLPVSGKVARGRPRGSRPGTSARGRRKRKPGLPVAMILGVPVKTLYQWRYKGVGPAGMRVGRHLRYRAADLELWIDGRVAEPGARRFA